MDYRFIEINGGIAIIVLIMLLILFFSFYIDRYLPFKEDRNYIKMEMGRASGEKEYLYWKRELKRLYLSLIPFVGRFFK